jgi:hypothetical protein
VGEADEETGGVAKIVVVVDVVIVAAIGVVEEGDTVRGVATGSTRGSS